MIAKLIIVAILLCSIVVADDITVTTEVENSLPVASLAELNGGSGIDLTAADVTSIEGTATIIDNNGCDEIDHVEAVLHRSDIDAGASDEGRTHYTDPQCMEDSCVSDTAIYTCYFDVEHYATPTDGASNFSSLNWIFNVTPYDSEGAGTSDNDSQDINTLTALNVDTSQLDFGPLELGEDTGATNLQTSLANDGNEALDIYIASDDIGCVIGVIPVSNIQYALASFTYGTGTNMSRSDAEVDIDIDRGTDVDSQPTKLVYFGLGLPGSGVSGICSGTITITALSDPEMR